MLVHLRLKNLAEEADLCAARGQRCEEVWMKHGRTMGVRDEKLVRPLLAMDSSFTLQDTLTECRTYEAARSAASAIQAPPAAFRGVSQYKQGKRAAHMPKAHRPPTTPLPNAACGSCGRHHGPWTCPAAESVCGGCGGKRHWTVDTHGQVPRPESPLQRV